MPKWIEFTEIPNKPKTKTKIWLIQTKNCETFLGKVKWFSAWRKYAFFPCTNTVYEQDCLRDIADFTENVTKEHKNKK